MIKFKFFLHLTFTYNIFFLIQSLFLTFSCHLGQTNFKENIKKREENRRKWILRGATPINILYTREFGTICLHFCLWGNFFEIG